jgi:hypothetical protein
MLTAMTYSSEHTEHTAQKQFKAAYKEVILFHHMSPALMMWNIL